MQMMELVVTHSDLLDESCHEGEEMVSAADVPWDSLYIVLHKSQNSRDSS